MSRRWMFAPLLAAAVAAPAMLINQPSGTDEQNSNADLASSSFLEMFDQGAGQLSGQADPLLSQLTEEEAEMLNPNSISYAPGATDFREVFRFDANPQWLQKNWPLVTRSQSLDGLNSYRVPLVTGPNPHDLTGALTYYFNGQNFCERISFYGFTGDATRVIQLGTETFGLKSDRKFGSGLYASQFGRKVRSVLVLESPTIIYKNESRQKVQVTIELNNPKGKYALSPEMQEIVNSGLSNASFQPSKIR